MSISKIYLDLNTIFSWYENHGAKYVYQKISNAEAIHSVSNPVIVALLENRNNQEKFIEILEFAKYKSFLEEKRLEAINEFENSLFIKKYPIKSKNLIETLEKDRTNIKNSMFT